ncbi:MAG: hypothetical protein MZW92_81485 [Comamonadaceae bacterium]|nr:hypothetical protein [Comamonadaceae bacterium]
MGFEHERIHLETSSVLIRELPLDAGAAARPDGRGCIRPPDRRRAESPVHDPAAGATIRAEPI